MEYFYTPPSNITADHLTIDGEEFSHLTHVMRKKAGDEIMVVDGAGMAYRAIIVEIAKRSAHCTVTERLPRLHEPPRNLTLAVGILKNPARFDFLVEKATELGVHRIVPLLTERTIARHAKTDRWQKIALAAMKQSGRCVLPQIDQLTPLQSFLRAATQDYRLIAHEKSDAVAVSQGATTIALCIGPEGGFTQDEIAEAASCGFQPFSLGPRRLRTETAGIVSVQSVISPG